MKKYLTLFLVALIYAAGLVYLSLPSPLTPDLADATRSDEPGDTWQNPDQKAFFSQKDRVSVLSQLQNQFSLQLSRLSLSGFRLNYPPEEAQTLVRDQLSSNYLEEVIHPLRESLYINGWEPKNAPLYAHISPQDRPNILINGIYYHVKVTLRPITSPLWARLAVWTLIFPASHLVYLSLCVSCKKGPLT